MTTTHPAPSTGAASTRALPRATPESQGVPSAAVLELVRALDGIDSLHALVLVRHGHIVAEASWAPFRADEPQHVYSVSKSFMATAVGFAVAEGLFGLDDRVVELFPESVPAVVDQDAADRLARLTVRHLLSMSTGHRDDTMSALWNAGDSDWVAAFLAVPLDFEPGTHFFYNTGASFVLSALVQKTSGLRLLDYLGPRLFEPLGITGASWYQNPQGVDFGGFGLCVSAHDIAALGELYLRGGRWGDRQLLPDGWAAAATSFQSDNSTFGGTADWQQGYGYQFWMSTHGYRGDGAFGQYCLVLPEQDAVVAITGSFADMQVGLYPVWELLPAFADDPLAEDPDAAAGLAAEVARLSVPAASGVRATATGARVAGMRFALDENPHGLEAIELRPGDDAATMVLAVAGRDHELAVGHREWRISGLPLWPNEGDEFAARGGWTGEREFRARIVSTASPLTVDVTVEFGASTVELTLREHVSFEPIVPVRIAGRA
jgi:CubicO group peptidase (beta-lactamase class C family)